MVKRDEEKKKHAAKVSYYRGLGRCLAAGAEYPVGRCVEHMQLDASTIALEVNAV